MAQEVAGSGITANALCPGYLNTETTEWTLASIVEKTGKSHADALDALIGRTPAPVDPARRGDCRPAVLRGPGSEGINGQAITIAGGEL